MRNRHIEIGMKTDEFVESLGHRATGTVIYIHPQLRFYRVEFKFKFGVIREAYLMVPDFRLAKMTAARGGYV